MNMNFTKKPIFIILWMLCSLSLAAQCDITFSNDSPCGGEEISLSVIPTGAEYSWDIDGDTIPDLFGETVFHAFPKAFNDIEYQIILFENNVECNRDTLPVLGIPDATIGIIPGSGQMEGNQIRVCSGSAEATLSVYNASATYDTNASYTIDWGDGSIENFDNSTFPNTGFITHSYDGFGYYDISVTVIGGNTCVSTQDYVFYNGSNPSVGLANPGNTVGLCVPATITFPITNTANNPVGTAYYVYVSGDLIESYTQENIPTSFTYTFTESSCGLTTSTGNYINAFDVQIEAINPCASSQATIEPIELSAPPLPAITIDEPFPCSNTVITVSNTSEMFEVTNGNCSSNLAASWVITPGEEGVDWNIISGNPFSSEILELEFLLPGDYTITMVVNSEACGDFPISETITVVEPPNADVELEVSTGSSPETGNCVPAIATFTNETEGIDATWYWYVNPSDGWEFINNTTAFTANIEIEFTEAGNYEVILFATNDCETSSWDTILTISAPPGVWMDEIEDFCEEATLNFNSSNIATWSNGNVIESYQWTFPGASPDTSSAQYPENIYYSGPGDYAVSLEITNACGTTSLTDSFSIIDPGAIELSNDTTVCIDADGFYLSADPAGGTWSGTGISLGGWFDPSVWTLGENIMTYEYINGECTVSGEVMITVVDIPVVEAGPNQSVCESDAPFFLSGNTPDNGLWTSDNGGIIISNSVFDPQASGPGIYTLTYTFANNFACENSDTKVVIVNELPTVEAGPDRSLCENPNDFQLTGFYPPDGIWTGVGVTPTGLFNVTNTPGLGSYSLFYNYTDPTTQCVNVDSLVITVFENPQANAGPDAQACIDDGLIHLNDGSPTGGIWSGPGVNSAAAVFDPQLAGPGLHVLTYHFGEGICATEDTKVIIVEALPEIQLPLVENVCLNENPIDLNSTIPDGGLWIGNGVSGGQFDPQVAGVGMHSLTYYYTHPSTGCSDAKSLEIEVYPLPEINVSDATYCDAPGVVLLPLADPSGGTWTGPGVDGVFFNPQLAGGVGEYVLNYSFTSVYACESSENVTIEVVAPPIVEAGPNDTLCIDQGLLQLTGASPFGAIWSGPGIIDAINGVFNPELAGGGTHVLTLSTGTGNCQTQDTRLVEVIDLTDVALGDGVEICYSESPISLNINGPAGGIWSGPGIIDTENGIFDPSLAGPGIHTITYTYTNTLIGCNAFIVKEITVHAMEAPTIAVPEIGCVNETMQLLNTSPANYSVVWDLGDGTTTTDFEPVHLFSETGTYEVSMLAENEFGCLDSVSQTVLITAPPTPLFALDTYEGCAPLEVDITNQSLGYDVTFFWYFSNGISSMEVNPPPVLFDQGLNDTTYQITLGVVNLCGASYYQDSVLVHPQPVAEFGIAPESNCTPVVANFANVSQGSATSFEWDFGNGNTSTDSIPGSQTYTTDTIETIYTITLTAYNQCGFDTAQHQLVVEPADVQSFFSVSTFEGCEPLTVNFSDYSTPGANVDWDFGDGNTSTLHNPVHTFYQPGEYTVIQYATNICGFDSTSVIITVNPIPDVSFTHIPFVCMGQEVEFTNHSVNTSGHFWDFGDGDTSNLNNPVHVFNSPGLHTVTLVGLSAFNQCPNTYTSVIEILDGPTASFAPSVTEGCVPLTIDFANNSLDAAYYEWSFGDGNFSVLQNPSHTYYEAGAYPISLIVTDAQGCFNDTTVFNVQVHPTPTVDFSFEREDLCGTPADIHFKNHSVGAVGYLWDFGDGNQSFLTEPTHTYYNSGHFFTMLTVSTAFGCADSMVTEVVIYPQPAAAFNIETKEGCSPLQIFFNNESSGSDHYYWNFGDGNTAQEYNPVHVFTDAGTYDIELVATSEDVCFDTIKLYDAVKVLQTPIANFEVLENPDGTFQLINHSQFADNYFWDFSDGTTSEAVNPEHRFLTNGIKQVYLEASADYGCVDDTIITITPQFMKALYIPNGFSPQQGIGDVRLFKPKGVGLKEYHMQVFSTYGQLIWESREIDEGQPTEAWDGTFKGQLLPQDVYVWKAFAVFEDGSPWRGNKDAAGNYQTMGSVILLR